MSIDFPRPRALSLALLACLAPLSAQAQDRAASPDAKTLDTVVVTADGSQVELPPAYAGGQVATGGRVGLFGNLDVMDTPFNSLNFTADLMRDQQARSVADVVQNDPAVRVARGFGNFQELYVVRGFAVYSDDMSYNGLYGLLPRQYVAAEFLERVEVFRGANSFLNGAAPSGSGVGGAFNLVPKRAGDDDLTRLTLGYENDGQGYAAADVSRRFGADRAWGVRANAVRRDGDTALGEARELGVLALGVDYRGERARFSADLGWQDHRIEAPRPSVTPVGGIPIAPDADVNFAQPWTFTDEEDLFGVIRGEYDLSESTMAWAALGVRDGKEHNVLANPRADAAGNLTASQFDNVREDLLRTGEVGLRTEFETGAVGHRISVSASFFDLDSQNAFATGARNAIGSLYAPIAIAPPPINPPVGDMSDPLTTSRTQTASYAIADTLSLADDRVLLTLGARRQTLRQSSYDYTTGVLSNRYDDSVTTPVAALVFKLGRQVSLYANYADALLPGETVKQTSADGTPIVNAGEILSPFRSKQYEAGAKFDAGGWGATAALFRIAKPNAIEEDYVVRDNGEQRNQGLEFSAYGQPVEGLRILGGFTLLDATLQKTEGGANEGNTVLGVPEVQLNAGVDWDVPGADGLSLDARAVHTGRQFANDANTLELPSWTRFDLGARYAFQAGGRPWTLRARVDNLFDRGYWASTGGASGANYLVLGAPRTITVSVSVDL
ncbi:TonB-dependent receptor [Luteimonas huabeiensis]|uniref:TonB-dependent receptor n=1 Tax=Luteimonas huabeiensis TaxID=1244513 RepID=UPI0004657EC1|nr:TonB-dependent siderophore receptor [Luteimonas huabeiensis]